PDNLIGGTERGQGNVISGNRREGIEIDGTLSARNRVQGNFIGPDGTGGAAPPNGSHGLPIWAGAGNNLVGGPIPGAGNLISGNTIDGIQINAGGRNTVQGNFIGTNADGSGALPNGQSGVVLIGTGGNMIGGTLPVTRNIISGNKSFGVFII